MAGRVDLLGGEILPENPGAPRVLSAPLRLVCAAASGEGKTMSLLRDVILQTETPFDYIIWAAPPHSLTQTKLAAAKAHLDEKAQVEGRAEGLTMVSCPGGAIDTARIEMLLDAAVADGLQVLVVCDDLLLAGANSLKWIAGQFTNIRHRGNGSIALLVQRLFDGGDGLRTARLNANAFMLGRTAAEGEVSTLFRQMLKREESADAMALYEDATREKYGYLLIDRQNPKPWRYRKSGLDDLYKNAGPDV